MLEFFKKAIALISVLVLTPAYVTIFIVFVLLFTVI